MATEAAWLNRGGLAKRDGDGKNHGKSKNSYRKKQNQFLTGIGLLMEGVGPRFWTNGGTVRRERNLSRSLDMKFSENSSLRSQ